MHIKLTALLEHIDGHLKIQMFSAWVFAAICLKIQEFLFLVYIIAASYVVSFVLNYVSQYIFQHAYSHTCDSMVSIWNSQRCDNNKALTSNVKQWENQV